MGRLFSSTNKYTRVHNGGASYESFIDARLRAVKDDGGWVLIDSSCFTVIDKGRPPLVVGLVIIAGEKASDILVPEFSSNGEYVYDGFTIPNQFIKSFITKEQAEDLLALRGIEK